MYFGSSTAGYVGIGTSSPSAKLDVNGAVHISPDTAGKNTFQLTTNASNDGRLLIKSDTTTKVDIQANGASYFNGGNIGIGTSSPQDKLHVYDGDVGIENSSGRRYRLIAESNGGFTIRDQTAASGRLAINSSGNVGIGTSSPQRNLHVNEDASNSYAYLRLEGANRGGWIQMYDGSNAVSSILTDQSGNMYLQTASGYGNNDPSTRMTIAAGGTTTFHNTVHHSGHFYVDGANNRISQNGVTRESKGGYINGNQTVSYTINHTNQSTFHIRCGFSHYGFLSYGCALDQVFANGSGGISSLTALINHTTSLGGSWSVARVDADNVTITKNAGTYSGGGYYYIIVEGANL